MLEKETKTGETKADPAAESRPAAEQPNAPKAKRARRNAAKVDAVPVAVEAVGENGAEGEQPAASKAKRVWKKSSDGDSAPAAVEAAGEDSAAGEQPAASKAKRVWKKSSDGETAPAAAKAAGENGAAGDTPAASAQPAASKRSRRKKGAKETENTVDAAAQASAPEETAQMPTDVPTGTDGKSDAPREIQAEAAVATAVADETEEAAPAPPADTTVGEQAAPSVQPALTETEKPAKTRIFVRPQLLVVLAVVFALLCCGAYCFANAEKPYTLASLTSDGIFGGDGTVAVTAQLGGNLFKSGEAWYCVSDSAEAPATDDAAWLPMEGSACTFNVPAGSYYLHIKDKSGRLTEDDDSRAVACTVLAVQLTPQKDYFAVEGRKEFTAQTVAFGGADTALTWDVGDDAVAVVTGGRLVATAVGETTLTATAPSGASGTAQIIVTDLITLPDMDTYGKPMLSAGLYTEEQGALIDEILFSRVAEAGDATRGGVLAAARFISLEFPYRVPYFFENGRLNPAWEGRPYADGEGRYYHKGMYLTESKYADLDPDGVRWGPAYWGQNLRNWETKYHFVSGYLYPNGLDCSGFVSWVLYNGGFDYGDIGAGMDYGIDDLSDIGDQRRITTELLQSDIIQAGDLIYCDGHMAIIIGISEEKIYVAEALFTSVRVTSFDRVYSAVPHALYTHIELMSEEYAKNGNGEGVVTPMWEQYDSVEETERYWNYNWR